MSNEEEVEDTDLDVPESPYEHDEQDVPEDQE